MNLSDDVKRMPGPILDSENGPDVTIWEQFSGPSTGLLSCQPQAIESIFDAACWDSHFVPPNCSGDGEDSGMRHGAR